MVPEIGNRKALQEKHLQPLCVVSCVVQNLVYTPAMLEKIVHWLIFIGLAGWVIGIILQLIRFGAITGVDY